METVVALCHTVQFPVLVLAIFWGTCELVSYGVNDPFLSLVARFRADRQIARGWRYVYDTKTNWPYIVGIKSGLWRGNREWEWRCAVSGDPAPRHIRLACEKVIRLHREEQARQKFLKETA